VHLKTDYVYTIARFLCYVCFFSLGEFTVFVNASNVFGWKASSVRVFILDRPCHPPAIVMNPLALSFMGQVSLDIVHRNLKCNVKHICISPLSTFLDCLLIQAESVVQSENNSLMSL